MAERNKDPSNTSSADTTRPPITSEELATLPLNQLMERLQTTPKGLSSEEAAEHLEIYGENVLAKEHKHSAVKEFLLHFKSPLIIILLVAAIISGFLGELANTVIILIIIFASIVLDSYQENKAEKAAELLKQQVTSTATVLRDGVRTEIKLPEIVPGDIIYLSAGDIIPADARVIAAKDFFVNQSALTGESFPVEKTPGVPEKEKIGPLRVEQLLLYGNLHSQRHRNRHCRQNRWSNRIWQNRQEANRETARNGVPTWNPRFWLPDYADYLPSGSLRFPCNRSTQS